MPDDTQMPIGHVYLAANTRAPMRRCSFFAGIWKRFPMLGCLDPDRRASLTGAPHYQVFGEVGGRPPNRFWPPSAHWGRRERRQLIRSARCRFPSSANGCRLCAACCASAAAFLEEEVEIFASVVVGYFVSRDDGTQRYEHDPTLAHHWLRIRGAGMIDVTCHIPPWRAVDNPSVVKFEHILGASSLASVSFLGRDAPATIGRDVPGPLDQLRREQAEASRRAGDAKGA